MFPAAVTNLTDTSRSVCALSLELQRPVGVDAAMRPLGVQPRPAEHDDDVAPATHARVSWLPPKGPGTADQTAYYVAKFGVRRSKTRRDDAVSLLQIASQQPNSNSSSYTSAAMASTTMSRALAGTPVATSSAPRRAIRSAPAASKTVNAAFFRPAFRQQRPQPAQRCGPRQACGPAGFAFGAGPMGFRGMVNGRPMSAEEMMRVRAELSLPALCSCVSGATALLSPLRPAVC